MYPNQIKLGLAPKLANGFPAMGGGSSESIDGIVLQFSDDLIIQFSDNKILAFEDE